MSYMVRNPGLIPSMNTLGLGKIQQKRTTMKSILEGRWRSCIKPDPKTGIPFVVYAIIATSYSCAYSWCPSSWYSLPYRFYHALDANLRLSTSIGKHSNTHTKLQNGELQNSLVQSLTWRGLGDIINEWRSTMDLEAVPLSEGQFLAEILKIPMTYCWSPALVPKPRDWPLHVDVCGFIFRDFPEYDPPPDLEAFLAADPHPIYIGFGSMVIENPEEVTRMLLDAIENCNVREIISRGWSKLRVNNTKSERVFYINDSPHEWLYKHVSAVLHTVEPVQAYVAASLTTSSNRAFL